MNNEKLKDFKEIIDSLDTGYYKKENEKLEKEINNIMMGRPRFEGIYDLINSGVVPENQREKEINRLKKEIKDNKKKAIELGDAIYQLKTSANKLEKLAEQDTLLREFKDYLIFWRSDKIVKTDIYQENRKKYLKLYFKSNKKLSQPKHKISKEMYKLIKQKSKERAHKKFGNYQSIGNALKDNRIQMVDGYTPGNRIFSNFHQEHIDFSNFGKLEKLGVKVDLIRYANDKINDELNPHSLTWQGKEAFDILKNIEKAEKNQIEIKGGYSKLRETKEKYTKIVELSRETWYMEEILNAFSDTSITNTEMYIGLKDLIREQEKELLKLTNEVDKIYEKTGLQSKVDLVEQLEELYNKTEELKYQIERFKNNGNDRQAEILEQEYFNLRYEMIKILMDNPDLDNPKYNIDIKNVIKEEMEMLEPEIKKEIKPTKDTNIKTDNLEIVEEKIESQTAKIEKEDVKKNPINESSDLTERFELNPNLQIFRTMHYQNYMKEKILDSDLGRLSFSDYLQTVAPNLTELINIEKERESLARTIYREYIKYYSALEDKELAISFEEYSVRNHGLSNIDVPIEREEEYEGMKKR